MRERDGCGELLCFVGSLKKAELERESCFPLFGASVFGG